ncbi:GNAT family N-acetyltransferase, partial [candidate division KSB1 bacterium]
AVVYLNSYDSDGGEIHVARLEGEIVGLVWFSLKGMFYQFGFVYLLAVTPNCRDRGIGTELMRFAEDRLLKYSRGVFLLVSDFNEGARRFYERRGYETYNILENYKDEGNDEILMWKPDWSVEEEDG